MYDYGYLNKGENMKSFIKTTVPAVLCAFVLIGCAGGASETKPIDQVQKEAASMDVAKLESMVKKYEASIQSKMSEIDGLKAKLKEIPLKELMGDDAKALKGDVDEVMTSVKALKDRLAVYAKALKAEAAK